MRSFFSFLPHLLGMLLIIGFGIYIFLNYHYQPDPIEILYDNIYLNEEMESSREVSITGAINQPGKYLIPPGGMLVDLITQAGDLTDEADLSGLNLAQLIESDNIYIPIKESVMTAVIPSQSSNSQLQDSKININTTSIEQLIELPGIGEKTAEKIIQYRRNNHFKSIEEIMEVSGIGEVKFTGIKDLISI